MCRAISRRNKLSAQSDNFGRDRTGTLDSPDAKKKANSKFEPDPAPLPRPLFSYIIAIYLYMEIFWREAVGSR